MLWSLVAFELGAGGRRVASISSLPILATLLVRLVWRLEVVLSFADPSRSNPFRLLAIVCGNEGWEV